MKTKHGRHGRAKCGTCDWQKPGSWCRPGAHSKGRGGGSRATGSPSLLLGNFSSCFLGTSYLQKRGEGALKGFQMGGPLPETVSRPPWSQSVSLCVHAFEESQHMSVWKALGRSSNPFSYSGIPLPSRFGGHTLTALFSYVLAV